VTLPASSGGIVYVPVKIQQQGNTITTDVEQLSVNTKAFWQQFQQSYQAIPQVVQVHLKAFEDTVQPQLETLLTRRTSIGHLLSGAASQMEEQDAQVQYLFDENVPLSVLTK
jgi:hypothetical protein